MWCPSVARSGVLPSEGSIIALKLNGPEICQGKYKKRILSKCSDRIVKAVVNRPVVTLLNCFKIFFYFKKYEHVLICFGLVSPDWKRGVLIQILGKLSQPANLHSFSCCPNLIAVDLPHQEEQNTLLLKSFCLLTCWYYDTVLSVPFFAFIPTLGNWVIIEDLGLLIDINN